MIHQVNYDAVNPLYAGAMRLGDADIGVNFLTFSVTSGDFWYTTLSSTPRIEHECVGNQCIEEAHFIANDSQGGTVNLTHCGIHPGHYGWDQDCFSVVVDPDNIREFYAWLVQTNGYQHAAEKLERLYPELMLG